MTDERAVKTARYVSARVSRNHRGYVEADDLLATCFEWLVRKQDKVDQWMQEGNHGLGKLNKALYRACFDYARRERARKSGTRVGDNSYYTRALLDELLPDVWSYDGWSHQGWGYTDQPTGPSRPAEGNNRLAMLCDVKWAVAGMPADDQTLLRDRYHEGPTPFSTVATWHEVTEDGARKSVERALSRLLDRLGGEPPWDAGGRRAVSNARAAADNRRTWE